MAAVSKNLSPSTTPNGRTPAGPSAPSRNSCVACAAAKMKCSKDKPSCVRCSRRGLQCAYFIPKRAGRKPNSARSSVSSTSAPSSETQNKPDNVPVQFPATQEEPAALPPDIQELLDSVEPMQWDPMLSSWETDSIIDGNYFPSQTPTPSTSISDFNFSTMIGLSENDMAFCNEVITATSTTTVADDPSQVASDPFLDLITSSVPENISTALKSLPQAAPVRSVQFSESCKPCACMGEVLGRLTKLCHLAGPVRVAFTSKQRVDGADTLQTIMDVLAKNKDATSTVDTVIQCTAEHDAGVIYSSSLVLFKVLGLYAAITCKTLPSQDKAPIEAIQRHLEDKSGFYRSSDELGAITAQIVLNELHRLRRVIEQLSYGLKERAAQISCSEMSATGDIPELDVGMAWPLPSTVLDQLGDSLRGQFKTLSLGIVDRLTAVRGEVPCR